MKNILMIATLQLLLINGFVLTGCEGASVRSDVVQPFTGELPDSLQFTAEGSGDGLFLARSAAYVNIVSKAALFLTGTVSYEKNRTEISNLTGTYHLAGKYILGETVPAPGKEKQWISTERLSNGIQVMKLSAWIDMKKLKADLDNLPLNDDKTSETNGMIRGKNPKKLNISFVTFCVLDNTDKTRSIHRTNLPDPSSVCVNEFEAILKKSNLTVIETNMMKNITNSTAIYANYSAEITANYSESGGKAVVWLIVKVYNSSTGAIVAALVRPIELAIDLSMPEKFRSSLKHVYSQFVPEIIVGIKRHIESGSAFYLIINNIAGIKEGNLFVRTVSAMPGIVSIRMTTYQNEYKRSSFIIMFQGTHDELLQMIFTGIIGKPGFESLDKSSIRLQTVAHILSHD